VSEGGGFFFDLLHCDSCGANKSVRHQDLGDIFFGYIKGLDVPYTMTTAERDRRIREEYPGKPLSKTEYHAAVEANLKPCKCGGRFRYDAAPRCPSCRSAAEMWDADETGQRGCFD
jgi:hypothetical protein